MKLPDWINPGLRKQFDQNHSEPKEERLRVTNITRNSVLATQLEVADTGAKRNKGLLGRKGLAPGGGLWIVPCESVHTIGMQFPIDLIHERKVLAIQIFGASPSVLESVEPVAATFGTGPVTSG